MSLGNKVGRKSKFSFRNNYNPLWAKPKSLLLRDADHGGSKYLDYGWSSKKLIQYCSRIQLKRKVQCMYILYQRSCQRKKNLISRLSVWPGWFRWKVYNRPKITTAWMIILKENKLILNHAVVVIIGRYLHFSVHAVDTNNST